MPQLKILILKANSIIDFKLKLSSQNYQNLVKFDIRNNKIQMTSEQIMDFASKMKKFKALEIFNMEANPGVNFEKEKTVYAHFVRSLPQSLDFFNNRRKIYIIDELKDYFQKESLKNMQEERKAELEKKLTASRQLPDLANLVRS